MDKYEYSLKLDEIKKLVTSGNYEEAVKVADTVEMEACSQYPDSLHGQ